jgi:hypothetical protein
VRKLPIGIQDFEGIRTDGWIYVDKTALMYRLATQGKLYFLSRPRRFGKSLLVSTLKAYFQGQRELFEKIAGQPELAVAGLEKDWIKHPVFHIDLTGGPYTNLEILEAVLDSTLKPLEEQWGYDEGEKIPSLRFAGLIRRAREKSGQKVVVLIDEYDKPLLETMDNPELNEEFRKTLKSFYGILKSQDQHLRFVLLTGVTKFSQVSVFSDLNQLQDISLHQNYVHICGITEAELVDNFPGELQLLAKDNDLSYDEALGKMRQYYNGYHFCENTAGVYNPFSVLNTLSSRSYNYYWFQTGTPAFLVNLLKETGFDLPRLSEGVNIPRSSINDYRPGSMNPVPVLYQSGYLTIKDIDREFNEYILGFPNEEVEYGFLEALLPIYCYNPRLVQDFHAGSFVRDLRSGNVDAFMTRLRAFFADIPYDLNDKTERHYQLIFYLIFKLLGQFVQVEVKSAKGRSDVVVILKDQIYVFEFKLSGSSGNTAEDAIKQIDEKGYLIPFIAGDRALIKVGVEFDPAERNIGRWVVERV